jgi:hypothetical protein
MFVYADKHCFFSETGRPCPYWILLKFKNREIQKEKRETKKQKGNKEINQAKEIRLDCLTIIVLTASISFWRAR